MMRFVKMIWIAVAVSSAIISAQDFDVASVKPSGPGSTAGYKGGPGTKDPELYSFGRANLKILIMIAYDVENFQVSGRGLERDEVDLAAKVPSGASRDDFRVMLRHLLAERFNLRMHVESREFPAYALSIAKGGPRLKTASAQSEPAPREWLRNNFPDLPPNRPGLATSNSASSGGSLLVRVKGQRQTVAQLARSLQQSTGVPVVDKTGINGIFDFTFEFARDAPDTSLGGTADPAAPAAPPVEDVVRRQLGLELVKRHLPFNVVVVDSFDRLPLAN